MALRFLLLLLLLAATLLFAQAQGLNLQLNTGVETSQGGLSPGIESSASDCCLKHSRKTIPSGVVTSYLLQGPESGCLLRAVVFTTKRGKKICASPTTPAVQRVMKYVDKVKNNKAKQRGPSQPSRGRPKQRRRQRA